MRRRTIWTIVWILAAALIGAASLLPANSVSDADARGSAEAMSEIADPAALDLGNARAADMMALINRSVGMHSR